MNAIPQTLLIAILVISGPLSAQDDPTQAPQAPNPAHPPMKLYYVMDAEAQMPVCGIRGPVGWTLDSAVQWNLNNNKSNDGKLAHQRKHSSAK